MPTRSLLFTSRCQRGPTSAVKAVEAGEEAGGRVGSAGEAVCSPGGRGPPIRRRQPSKVRVGSRALPGAEGGGQSAHGGGGELAPPPLFSRPRPSGEADYTSHNAPRPPLLARDGAAEVTRRGPEAPPLWSRESAEPTMAETDPKTVQDLTAVVRPPGPGPPSRGERGAPSGPGAAAERGAGGPRPP